MIAFSHPWALLLALPAAWLLWRARRPDVETREVGNVFLWLDSPLDPRAAAQAGRPLPPWLVWLQAAVLVLVAAAISWPSRPDPRPAAALILDVSMSMSARTGDASRIESARAAAKQWLSAQPRRSAVSVIAAGARAVEAEVVEAGSPGAADAIDRLDATDASGELADAIALARRRTSGRVAVITDLPAPATIDRTVEWRQIGGPADNVAITNLAGTEEGGAIAEVTNFGAAARRASLAIDGGAAPRREQFEIGPAEVRAFLIEPGPDRTLSATLTVDGNSGNAISRDDRRSAEIRRVKRLNVVLIGDQPMIAAALRALPQTDVTVIADGEPLDSHDVVVCSRACDPPPRTAALLFAPGGVVPAIDRQESADLRTIRVAADLESSPWALTPAFPLFVADAVEWLTRRQTPALSNADVRAIAESDTRGTVAPRVDELTYATASAAPRTFWFALAALALLGILIDAFVRRRNVALRIVAAAMVGAALAGLTLPLGTSDRTAVIVADASASVAGQQRAIGERVRQETSRAVDADRADILRFGGTDTDIAAALRSARVRLPPTGDRRLLLLSDGRQTIGDGLLEARASAATGIPIDVIPIDSRVPAYIERVDAPVTTRIGAAVPIRISLRGRKDETLRLTVSRNGQALDSRRVILNDVGTGAVVITDKPMDAGVTFYRATLADERTGLTVSEAGAGVAVEGRGRVLVISERRGVFTQLIGGGPLNAVNIAPAAAPDTRETLSAFSAIVMDAVPPHRLTGRQLDAIAAAVAIDGAGLLVLGNRESLDPSEFPASAFVDSLPVDFTELSAPPSTATSLALLVDISGSMAATSDGVTKISAARDAIARALSVVPKTDAVEVIGFAAAPSVVIGPNDPRDAQSIAAKLSALSPSGTTALSPAVRDAVAWLKQTPGRRRRLLLVTDGKTSVADAEATRAAVSGQSIEVSVVTIGVDAERDWLVELAAANGGRAVFPDRLSDLARLVAREASPSGDGRDISERFVVRAGTHPLAPGPRGPTLDGYIAGRLRDGAVAAWKSQRDDAVLAAWARGLGRVAVFSSDLDGAWGQPLRSWAPNAAFWTRAIQWLARGSDLTGLDAELALSTEGPRLVVDIGRLPRLRTALPQVRASIAGPSGQTLAVMLHAVSPTRFEGAAALAEAGDYRASITVSDASVLEQRATRGWYWTGDQESQSRGMNVPLLGEIARTSGGRVLAPLGSSGESADGVFSGPRQRSRVNPMAWLLVAALALLSFDYLRRINEV